MSRTITLLALIQLLLVGIGFFALGIVLTLHGYPGTSWVRWNPLAVHLREHGLWLSVVPVLWVQFATAAERLEQGFLSSRIACVLGIAIAVGILGVFLYAAYFPYSPRVFLRFN